MGKSQSGGEETRGRASVSDVDLFWRSLEGTAVAVQDQDFAFILPAVAGASQLGNSGKHELGVIRVEQVANLALALGESCEKEDAVGDTLASRWPARYVQAFGHTRLDQHR